ADAASARGRRARRLRKRAGRSSRSAAAGERAFGAASRQRDNRNPHGHGRSRRRQRPGGARRRRARHPGAMTVRNRRSVHVNVAATMRTLTREIDGLELPAVEKISEENRQDPFEVLVATMLSAQTRDAVTASASARLFKRARTPKAMAALPTAEIERLIY